MTGDEALAVLRESGALIEGHFILSSGRHSDLYVEKFRVLERPLAAKRLGEAMAGSFDGADVDVVLAPAVGGIILGFATALALAELGKAPRSVLAEREDSRLNLRRGFQIAAGEKVLIVEDIVTTGASVKELVTLAPPGELIGIGCLLDRSEGVSLPVPLKGLASIPPRSWDPADCPMCERGIPADSPGSRHL